MPRNSKTTAAKKTRRGLLQTAAIMVREALQAAPAGPRPLELRDYTPEQFAADHRRDLTTREFAIRKDTYDATTRTVEAVLATENMVRVFDMSTWEIIDEVLRMDGLELPAARQVPLLDTHNRHSIFAQLGSTRDLRVESGQLIGRRHFDATDDGKAAEIKVRDGHVTDGSIGYAVTNAVRIEPGKSADVNGTTYTASPERALRVALAWTVREDSLCPIGADGAAKVRAAEPTPTNTATHERKDRSMDYAKWLKSVGMDAARMSPAQETALRALYEENTEATRAEALEAYFQAAGEPAEPQRTAPPATPPAADPADIDARVDARMAAREAAEAARVAEIRELGELCNVGDDAIRSAIDGRLDVPAARAAFKTALATRNAAGVPFAYTPAIHSGDSQLQRAEIEAAVLIAGGADPEAVHRVNVADTAVADADAATERAAVASREMSISHLCRMVCAANGIRTAGDRVDLIRQAMSIRADFATISLTGILSATANKALLMGYRDAPDVTSLLARQGRVNDFKAAPRYRAFSLGRTETLNTAGEFPMANLGEESATIIATTKGLALNIPRPILVNDDLGALVPVWSNFGRQAQKDKQRNFFEILLGNPTMTDGKALFIAAHGNLLDGSTYALSADTLAAAMKLFRDQRDANGDPIGVDPRFLLVSTDNELLAGELCRANGISANVDDAGAVLKPNPFLAYGLRMQVAPWLNNSNLTGYSTTGWYLMASPTDADTWEIAYLHGKRQPTVDMFDRIPGKLGMRAEVYFDYGIAALDHRAQVFANGA